jgi:hypothetical protein
MRSQETPSPRRGATKEARQTFLRRLARLIRMRRDYREDLNPLGIRLLDRAIESTFQDCVDFGGAREARALMTGYVPAGDNHEV